MAERHFKPNHRSLARPNFHFLPRNTLAGWREHCILPPLNLRGAALRRFNIRQKLRVEAGQSLRSEANYARQHGKPNA
jgi:hypothetical protein